MSAVFIWERHKTIPFKKLAPILFLAGFVAAMGKNEWSLLFFLAFFATAFCVLYKHKKNNKGTKSDLLTLLCLLVGLIAGNLFSYFFDSSDYMAGLELMNLMSHKSSLMNTSQVGSWWTITKIRLPILYLSLALWLYMTSIFVIKKPWKVSTPIILSFFVSSAFLWSFFLTSWDATDRYFIPAFMALVFTVMLIRTIHTLSIDKYTTFIILFLGMDIFNNYLTSLKNHEYRVDFREEYLRTLPTKQGCIHHITYYAFNLKNIDYVGVGNGPGNLEGYLKSSGEKLCE